MNGEYKLDNGNFLIIKVLKVISIPYSKDEGFDIKKHFRLFRNLLNEIYQLGGKSIALELLWIPVKISNNIHNSSVELFLILRKIGKDKEREKNVLFNISKNIINSLKNFNYELKEIEYNDASFMDKISGINTSKVYALVKKEKLVMNQILPYYYSNLLALNSYNDMNSIINTFIDSNEVSLSFQLIPTSFTDYEIEMMKQYAERLDVIKRGFRQGGIEIHDSKANIPKDYYEYYFEKRDSSNFLYNIIVTGSELEIGSLATKIISHLKEGDSTLSPDFNCIDVSCEGVNVKKQFPNYVWNINAILMNKYRNKAILNQIPQAKMFYRMPYIVSGEEAVNFFRIPFANESTIGININKEGEQKENFDSKIFDKNNIKFGKLKNISNEKGLEIGCSEKNFTKHALIVGMPGSGKTTFSINLLLQFAERKIPFLAIEPTKTEYRALIDAVKDLQIFIPGNSDTSPFIINPFIPPRGIKVERYIPALANAFKAAFSMPSPLDMIFLKAIRSTYTKYGWKDYNTVDDPEVQKFGMCEFIKEFKKLIGNMNYGKEVKGNLESAGVLRLMNLIDQNSNIYDNINTIPIEDLLSKPTVIELNAIENAEQKSLLMALLLINICVYTKANHLGDGELKNIVLIDEAHVLLNPNTNDSNDNTASFTTIRAIQDMIVEIRSYGTGIIIADQAPTKVTREVVGNTDIKVAFKLVQAIEKELIGDSTNMDEQQIDNLARLKTGEAYVHFNSLEKAQLIMTDDVRKDAGIKLSVSDEEIREKMVYWKDNEKLLIPYKECLCTSEKCTKCNFRVRADAEFYAASIFEDIQGKIGNKGQLIKVIIYSETLLRKKYNIDELDKLLIKCFKIKLLRKMLLNTNFELNESEISKIIDYNI